MGLGPTIEVSVILHEMRLRMAEAFSEHEGMFRDTALKALEAAMSEENIARLFKDEAKKFIESIVQGVFSDYGLRHTIASKIARSIEAKIEE